ncbi:MAG TPA: ArsR family transcriptional regulator [Candidatus Binatia bacterium]|nr:ArsR family transcriptional regulator [Candidatus Binatia bacterium]
MTRPQPEDEAATRERILALLRRGPATVHDLSREVDVTPNSVRVQLGRLERDGLVRRAGVQRRLRKPAFLYALSAEAERGFSKAYIPFLASLIDVVRDRLGPDATADVLREVGRRLAAARPRHHAAPERRVRDALDFLRELGGAVEVERQAEKVVVRGLGCPLAEVVRDDARVCGAMESLLSEIVGAPVRESCHRGDRPSCCFEIDPPATPPEAPVATKVRASQTPLDGTMKPTTPTAATKTPNANATGRDTERGAAIRAR